jgi:hypothetical protein
MRCEGKWQDFSDGLKVVESYAFGPFHGPIMYTRCKIVARVVLAKGSTG